MTFTWEKHLSIGNRIIDSAHKEVLDIINNIIGLTIAKNVAALPEALELLESYLYEYFAVEENIAQAVNFDFDQHNLVHRYLLNKVHRMKDKLAYKNGLWPDTEERNYIHSLRDYFIQHIKEDSKPLKIVLDTHFYDFKPQPNITSFEKILHPMLHPHAALRSCKSKSINYMSDRNMLPEHEHPARVDA